MGTDTLYEEMQRALLFCQMFSYGFGRAAVSAIQDQVADSFVTFADAHLVFSMFLVDKKQKPIGGFIYPILAQAGKEELCGEIIRILGTPVGETTFEDYLRQWRNKLATHDSLSTQNLPPEVRHLVLSDDHNADLSNLLDELRAGVENLLIALHQEVKLLESAS